MGDNIASKGEAKVEGIVFDLPKPKNFICSQCQQEVDKAVAMVEVDKDAKLFGYSQKWYCKECFGLWIHGFKTISAEEFNTMMESDANAMDAMYEDMKREGIVYRHGDNNTNTNTNDDNKSTDKTKQD